MPLTRPQRRHASNGRHEQAVSFGYISDIPAGLVPFGIANIDNNLYVTYANQNANDVIPSARLAFVDVFTTDAVLIKRFASRATLNAPWGIARATQYFDQFSGAILIGNFSLQGEAVGPDQCIQQRRE